MGQRLDLQTLLEGLLDEGLTVYFQPPANIQMTYPCVVYKRDSEMIRHANDHLYYRKKRYMLTVIDQDPDSLVPDLVGALPLCRFVRHFTVDDLNHDIYNLYY